MNVDGKEKPEGVPITATSWPDGRGRLKSSLLDSPKACSTAMATITTSAARTPASRHAPSTARLISTYLSGALAVASRGATQPVPGDRACTARSTAMSPGR